MSEHAIVMTCNPGYDFGMISTMNAQNYFGTDADFEIAYEGFSYEYRKKISEAFRFNVNWTPLESLIVDLPDRRTNPKEPLNRFWVGYWLLAYKLLKEKRYKSVCVTQADQFTFVNLDAYFALSRAGYLVCSEFDQNYLSVYDLPIGDDKAIWGREMCPIFDALIFLSQEYAELAMDIVRFQSEDPFKDESNHSVIALNRAVCRHGKKNKILGLAGRSWLLDRDWHSIRYQVLGDSVWSNYNLQIKGWHSRWWQEGRAEADLRTVKDPSTIEKLKHNYNLVRDFMARFNDMRPEIKSEAYVKAEI